MPEQGPTSLRRVVGTELELSIPDAAELALQVAVAATLRVDELLDVRLNGSHVGLEEVPMPHGGRAHLLTVGPGLLTVGYTATVTGYDVPGRSPDERLTYLRPSRYAESDRLAAVAAQEFAGLTGAESILAGVSSWVGSRIVYESGSSLATHSAVDTLLDGRGVCRDFAHLVTALLRALGVPARIAAVYAPGLSPMDFHAVVEALVEDEWRVVDATLLAPRASLVRIATGRDAADTAFLTTLSGEAELVGIKVDAVVDGLLPDDDPRQLVSLG